MSTNFDAIDLGTVAMVKNQHGVWNRCILTFHPSENHDFGFAWRPGIADTYYTSDEFRRLVVIDPEDEAEVERLMTLYVGTPLTDDEVPDMQRALRKYASPTPPVEEPKGLGAVVVTAKGEVFVRAADAPDQTFPWTKAGDHYQANAYAWDEEGRLANSNAVKVLSEGYIREAKS